MTLLNLDDYPWQFNAESVLYSPVYWISDIHQIPEHLRNRFQGMIASDGEHPSLEDEEISHQQPVGGLRILTWNINGIRSLVDFPKVLQELPADVICLQETKVTTMLSFLSRLISLSKICL